MILLLARRPCRRALFHVYIIPFSGGILFIMERMVSTLTLFNHSVTIFAARGSNIALLKSETRAVGF